MQTTMTSREFNQDRSRLKRAARKGPVFITDRGEPALVVMSIEEYRRITEKKKTIGELLSMPGIEKIELDLPARTISSRRPFDYDD